MYIEEWQWDDANLEELHQHELDRHRVEQVHEENPRFRGNKGGHAATHMMVGPDFGGTIWCICIVQCPGEPGLWRAITGWRANKAERDWYRRSL